MRLVMRLGLKALLVKQGFLILSVKDSSAAQTWPPPALVMHTLSLMVWSPVIATPSVAGSIWIAILFKVLLAVVNDS